MFTVALPRALQVGAKSISGDRREQRYSVIDFNLDRYVGSNCIQAQPPTETISSLSKDPRTASMQVVWNPPETRRRSSSAASAMATPVIIPYRG